jgi:hypothetical protein
LQEHTDVLKLGFLPHHFLLSSIGKYGVLRYQDTSTGAIVAQHKTKLGRCGVMKVNPYNAAVGLGHSNGTVSKIKDYFLSNFGVIHLVLDSLVAQEKLLEPEYEHPFGVTSVPQRPCHGPGGQCPRDSFLRPKLTMDLMFYLLMNDLQGSLWSPNMSPPLVFSTVPQRPYHSC